MNEQSGENALRRLSIEEKARNLIRNQSICEKIIQQIEVLVYQAHQAPEWTGDLT